MGERKIQHGNNEFDLVVIGSGPAGIQAALQAAKQYKRVCVVEKNPERLGGSWIHTGTIPSKTVRESLDAIHNIRYHAGGHWVDRVIADLSTTKLFGRARMVSDQEENLVRKYLEKNSIILKHGYGCIEDHHSVRVTMSQGQAEVLKTENILIATGSRPRRPANVPFDGWRVVDSDEILRLEHIPQRIVIYGAGVIGCEYACIFSAMGVDTTIVDSRTRIMQTLDSELSQSLEASMRDLGVKFRMGKELENIRVKGPVVAADLGEDTIETDVLFFAAGRVSNTERLGLEKMGVRANDRGAIEVNQYYQTNIPNIYAAGDAIGSPALAATSAQQGRYAALHMFKALTIDYPQVFPVGVYTIPELSCVGQTEDELKKAGVDYVVGRAHYRELARGYIRGEAHGLLKLLVDRQTHRILGIHVHGEDACNLVHIGMAFMLKGGHAQDLVTMIFNYPTLAEAYRIAAFNALNKIFVDGVIGSPPQDGDQSGVHGLKKPSAA